MARYILVGPGTVGARVCRQLLSLGDAERIAVVGTDRRRSDAVVNALGPMAVGCSWQEAIGVGADAVVLASPRSHSERAVEALEAGAHVVSVADAEPEVKSLLELDAAARAVGRSLVVGAGYSPGLSCLLALHAAAGLDSVDEVRVASFGTAGPACARHRQRSLGRSGSEWSDGAWARRGGGSGRELCWFPDPVGSRDCYRADMSEPLLLQRQFPTASRITARRAATLADLVTARLPVSPPVRGEGMLGALRVEVTGRRGEGVESRVLGSIDRPAVAAGTVAALAASWAAGARLARSGAGSLAEMLGEPVPFLRTLAERGIRAAAFTGTAPV